MSEFNRWLSRNSWYLGLWGLWLVASIIGWIVGFVAAFFLSYSVLNPSYCGVLQVPALRPHASGVYWWVLVNMVSWNLAWCIIRYAGPVGFLGGPARFTVPSQGMSSCGCCGPGFLGHRFDNGI